MHGHADRRAVFATFTFVAILSLVTGSSSARQKQMSVGDVLDHLILAAADLDAGMKWFEERTGVRPAMGGTHPGRGTRNALVALTGRQYLEILAPDPAQPADLTTQLRSLSAPRLVGWAAANSDLEGYAKRMRQMGHEPTAVRPGSRARPDGRVLKWTTIGFKSEYASGGVDPIPFVINWAADSAHPSSDSPKGCELTSVEFEHPNAEGLTDALGRLEIAAVVKQADAAAIVATLKTPKGSVVIR